MPPGWVAQWDQNGQRWYYIDQATGRSQWEPPAHAPPAQGPYAPPPSGPPGAPYNHTTGHDERGLFGASHDQNNHGYPGGPSDPYGSHGDPYGEKGKKDKEKKDKGHSTGMLVAAGAGGLVAGGLVGHALGKPSPHPFLCRYPPSAALTSHELGDDSDDETHVTNNYYGAPPAAAPAAAAPMAAPPPAEPPAFQEPPPVPTHDADGDSISSSDRESLEEKRQELIEAQEEYEEELEEAYDD